MEPDRTMLDLPVEGMTCASCAARHRARSGRACPASPRRRVNYAVGTGDRAYDPAWSRPADARRDGSATSGTGAREPRPRDPDADEAARASCAGSCPPRVLTVPLLLVSMIERVAVRRVGVVGARVRDAGRLVGGWMFHRAALANAAARRGDDGHAHLARHDRRRGRGRSSRCCSSTTGTCTSRPRRSSSR